MATTALKSPGTITNEDRDGKVAWADPTNAASSNDADAVCDAGAAVIVVVTEDVGYHRRRKEEPWWLTRAALQREDEEIVL